MSSSLGLVSSPCYEIVSLQAPCHSSWRGEKNHPGASVVESSSAPPEGCRTEASVDEMKEVSRGRETWGIRVPPPRLNPEALRLMLGHRMTPIWVVTGDGILVF